ncbi:MAG: glycosyltransferase [Clostridia bacterium]|nr:glycosyltransferase [Clostridia bacterium]
MICFRYSTGGVTMLETFADVFFIIAKIFAIYFGIISVFALIKPKKTPETERRLKFAVLIPARNERACIAGIIDSIKRQNYPSDCADVIVIPNNCTDDTAAVARDAGAKIMDMPPSVCSKGAALREAMARLCEDSDYDAFCVFDADNEADENFLAAMNRTLCAGRGWQKAAFSPKTAGSPGFAPATTYISAWQTSL